MSPPAIVVFELRGERQNAFVQADGQVQRGQSGSAVVGQGERDKGSDRRCRHGGEIAQVGRECLATDPSWVVRAELKVDGVRQQIGRNDNAVATNKCKHGGVIAQSQAGAWVGGHMLAQPLDKL